MDIFKQNVEGTAWFLLVANSQNVRGEKKGENLVKDYSIQMKWGLMILNVLSFSRLQNMSRVGWLLKCQQRGKPRYAPKSQKDQDVTQRILLRV